MLKRCDSQLPAWLHLPPGYSGGKVPVVRVRTYSTHYKAESAAKVLRAGDSPPLKSGDGRMESRLLSPGGVLPVPR